MVRKSIINCGNIKRRAIYLHCCPYGSIIELVSEGKGWNRMSKLALIQLRGRIALPTIWGLFLAKSRAWPLPPITRPHRNSCSLLESCQPQEVLERTVVSFCSVQISASHHLWSWGQCSLHKITSWYNIVIFTKERWYQSTTFDFSSFPI